jgi:regulator of RNase E activity RraA
VVGDEDGVVVIPRAEAAEVLVAAEAKFETEERSRAEARGTAW